MKTSEVSSTALGEIVLIRKDALSRRLFMYGLVIDLSFLVKSFLIFYSSLNNTFHILEPSNT